MPYTFIFDLDGTLVNTIADIRNSLNTALLMNGFSERTSQEVKRFIGKGARRLIIRAVGEGKADDVYDKVLLDYSREYNAHVADESKAYEGIQEVLCELKQRGCKLAVLSNKDHIQTRVLTKKLFPEIKFDAVCGHRDGMPHKPDPTVALEIAKQLGVNPDDVLFVGDSETDYETAKAARMHSVSVTWGYRTRDELEDAGQTIFCSNPDSLILFAKGYKTGLDAPLPIRTKKRSPDALELFGISPVYIENELVRFDEDACAFTGHRPQKLGIETETDGKCLAIMMRLEEEILKAVDDGFYSFITGMADGIDIWAAMSVIRVKRNLISNGKPEGIAIRLYAVLPYANFAGRGQPWQRERYEEILSNCEAVYVMGDVYTRDCMRRRNEFIVDHASRLIACTNGTPGGTEMTIKMAKKKGIEIRTVDLK